LRRHRTITLLSRERARAGATALVAREALSATRRDRGRWFSLRQNSTTNLHARDRSGIGSKRTLAPYFSLACIFSIFFPFPFPPPLSSFLPFFFPCLPFPGSLFFPSPFFFFVFLLFFLFFFSPVFSRFFFSPPIPLFLVSLTHSLGLFLFSPSFLLPPPPCPPPSPPPPQAALSLPSSLLFAIPYATPRTSPLRDTHSSRFKGPVAAPDREIGSILGWALFKLFSIVDFICTITVQHSRFSFFECAHRRARSPTRWGSLEPVPCRQRGWFRPNGWHKASFLNSPISRASSLGGSRRREREPQGEGQIPANKHRFDCRFLRFATSIGGLDPCRWCVYTGCSLIGRTYLQALAVA